MEDKNNRNDFQVVTRGNANPHGKPRVYFTCHPKDFHRSFDKICKDLFDAWDVAIYYVPDMTEPIPAGEREVRFNDINLFVIPVSFRLLTEPSRAMDDFAFAKEKKIPVLPIRLEGGLDSLYGREEMFGKRQYLDPYSQDATAISYEEKLKKFLSASFADGETVERIRRAFSLRIFLSYRKKDRRHANQLMRKIHKTPHLRDAAIWYDEYITPGEAFDSVIAEALKESQLVTLLVTPNLVNEKNYVQTVEYPMAREAGKPILPVEMVPTDGEELKRLYEEIPVPLSVEEESFTQYLSELPTEERAWDPEHYYLMGLAYWGGIEVETDREQGLAFITRAAEEGNWEAMDWLWKLYYNGTDGDVDYGKAVVWAKRLVGSYTDTLGERHPDTLSTMNNLASTYGDMGEYTKAVELQEQVYRLSKEILGERHPDTLSTMNNLAVTYWSIGEYTKAMELLEQVYRLRKEILGERHPDTLTAMDSLAEIYGDMGEDAKANELYAKLRELGGGE